MLSSLSNQYDDYGVMNIHEHISDLQNLNIQDNRNVLTQTNTILYSAFTGTMIGICLNMRPDVIILGGCIGASIGGIITNTLREPQQNITITRNLSYPSRINALRNMREITV